MFLLCALRPSDQHLPLLARAGLHGPQPKRALPGKHQPWYLSVHLPFTSGICECLSDSIGTPVLVYIPCCRGVSSEAMIEPGPGAPSLSLKPGLTRTHCRHLWLLHAPMAFACNSRRLVILTRTSPPRTDSDLQVPMAIAWCTRPARSRR